MLRVVRDHRIELVGEHDLADLLPLMRAYCDFYAVAPPDPALLDLSRALIAEPDREGAQVLARDESGRAVGFATVFWSWSTLSAARIGVMNDLYVVPEARGRGIGGAMTVAPLLDARALGYRVGILQASDMGLPVYRRLGFQVYCQMRHYTAGPQVISGGW